MDDPMILVFSICWPVPKKEKPGAIRSKSGRRIPHRKYWFDGYLPTLVDVWHVDPEKDGDEDSCHAWRHRDAKPRRLWLHIHHWKVNIIPWRNLRRWLFTRCYVCGKRLPYGRAALRDRGGDTEKPGFMQSEFGVRHFPDSDRCDEDGKLAWDLWKRHRRESYEMQQELRSNR